jgi:hypothetical protein
VEARLVSALDDIGGHLVAIDGDGRRDQLSVQGLQHLRLGLGRHGELRRNFAARLIAGDLAADAH